MNGDHAWDAPSPSFLTSLQEKAHDVWVSLRSLRIDHLAIVSSVSREIRTSYPQVTLQTKRTSWLYHLFGLSIANTYTLTITNDPDTVGYDLHFILLHAPGGKLERGFHVCASGSPEDAEFFDYDKAGTHLTTKIIRHLKRTIPATLTTYNAMREYTAYARSLGLTCTIKGRAMKLSHPTLPPMIAFYCADTFSCVPVQDSSFLPPAEDSPVHAIAARLHNLSLEQVRLLHAKQLGTARLSVPSSTPDMEHTLNLI